MTMGRLILITGPTRSGKSAWAEKLAQQTGKTVIYIATARIDPSDAEWTERILVHQQRRPANWLLADAPDDLTAALTKQDRADSCLLVDSLGTWVANNLERPADVWNDLTHVLLTQLKLAQATRIIVAEETGWGVVPAYPLGRTFRDRLGQLACDIGVIADAVYLVAVGYALDLRRLGTPLIDNKRE